MLAIGTQFPHTIGLLADLRWEGCLLLLIGAGIAVFPWLNLKIVVWLGLPLLAVPLLGGLYLQFYEPLYGGLALGKSAQFVVAAVSGISLVLAGGLLIFGIRRLNNRIETPSTETAAGSQRASNARVTWGHVGLSLSVVALACGAYALWIDPNYKGIGLATDMQLAVAFFGISAAVIGSVAALWSSLRGSGRSLGRIGMFLFFGLVAAIFAYPLLRGPTKEYVSMERMGRKLQAEVNRALDQRLSPWCVYVAAASAIFAREMDCVAGNPSNPVTLKGNLPMPSGLVEESEYRRAVEQITLNDQCAVGGMTPQLYREVLEKVLSKEDLAELDEIRQARGYWSSGLSQDLQH